MSYSCSHTTAKATSSIQMGTLLVRPRAGIERNGVLMEPMYGGIEAANFEPKLIDLGAGITTENCHASISSDYLEICKERK